MHIRSLFLSKFLFQTSHNVIILKSITLLLGFKKEIANYGLANLFIFLLSKFQPVHTLNFLTMRGKKKIKFSNFRITLRKSNYYSLIEKFVILHFPNLENWIGIKKNFLLKRTSRNLEYINIFDFSIFYDLDFLVNFNYSTLQSFSHKWMLQLAFSAEFKNYYFFTFLRSLELPVFIK